MSAVLRPVADEFVVGRVAELSANKELHPPAGLGLHTSLRGVLKMLADAGIVTAMRVDGEHREQAVAVDDSDSPQQEALAELLAAYRDGTDQHIREMRVAWPPLLAAVEKLAELHPVVTDPLLGILKEADGAPA